MKSHLSFVLATLKRVRKDPRMEHVHREHLRKAQREFEILGRSGKLDKDRLFRAAKLLCDALSAALEAAPEKPEVGGDSDDPVIENDPRAVKQVDEQR